MKTIKTYALQGADLEWAVASIEKLPSDLLVWKDSLPIIIRTLLGHTYTLRCEFSTHWAQGGPIIERETIGLEWGPRLREQEWLAWTPVPEQTTGDAHAYGPTPLIAAMRCYVASKLGDEVSIPEPDQ